MEQFSALDWHPSLADPTGKREGKPRRKGRTMVIDKGLGLGAYADLLRMASSYIDCIKLGFGTSALYPAELLQRKIELARAADIHIMPGGTFLELAVAKERVDDFLRTVIAYGFTAIEISDGTIEMSRNLRSSLIIKAIDAGLTVFTEYGKKLSNTTLEIEKLAKTVEIDTGLGAQWVTVEARESGKGVGIFNENGDLRQEELRSIVASVGDASRLMWEAPLKTQQAELIQHLGTDLNIGNVSPEEVLALEALRRGLRSDTFAFGLQQNYTYAKGGESESRAAGAP
jgi:phosphosulfolactate synthase